MSKKNTVDNLYRTLIQVCGNKRYFNSIDSILEKVKELDLTNAEIEALKFLSNDLRSVNNQKKTNKPWC